MGRYFLLIKVRGCPRNDNQLRAGNSVSDNGNSSGRSKMLFCEDRYRAHNAENSLQEFSSRLHVLCT